MQRVPQHTESEVESSTGTRTARILFIFRTMSDQRDVHSLVPETDALENIYSHDLAVQNVDLTEEKARLKNLLTQFKEHYGHSPDLISRSPGRVNIIGEHIDYSLYNVLPMAVTVDVLIAVKISKSSSTETSSVKIANTNPKGFPTRAFEVPARGDIDIDATKHEWTNYFKAGMRGALNFLRAKAGDGLSPASMEILVDGNVPAGGGLSSSAAFVCASALATLKANGHHATKKELFDITLVSEQAVGVYSGGMDQAASIFSLRGSALYTSFFPEFSVEHVEVPKTHPEISFLVAQSFVAADKHVTAPRQYNLRVMECTFAALVLAKTHKITLQKDKSSLEFSLRNFHHEYSKTQGHLEYPLEKQLDEIFKMSNEVLKREDGYTREEIASILGISVEELQDQYMSKFPVEADKFMLRQRAHHVFTEAHRVLDFKSALADTSGTLGEDKLRYLGGLMDETQHSCHHIFDNSTEELQDICEIARKAGSYGSRLTGAGWGGCTVHLIPQSKVQDVIAALKKDYYLKKFPDITDQKLKEALVLSKPSMGSYLYVNESSS